MQLLWLQYFCSVARYESIAQAARHHGIPQPAMSITIKKLERELDAVLFDRLGNRLRLNESGRRFYRYAQRSLALLTDGVNAVTENVQAPSGEVRLLLLESHHVVMQHIFAFQQRYPKITFALCNSLHAAEVFEGDLFIGVRRPLPLLDEKSALIDEEILVAVPRGHPLAAKSAIGLNELQNEQFALLPKDSDLSALCLSACAAHHLEPQLAIISDDPYYVRQYVEMGRGLTFVPEVSWRGLFSSRVKLLHVRGVDLRRTTYVYWSREKYMSLAVRTYLQDLRGAQLG